MISTRKNITVLLVALIFSGICLAEVETDNPYGEESLIAQPRASKMHDRVTITIDLKTGREILNILRRLNRERGVTIICATHDHRMLDICDRLMWIRDGQIERVARRDEVHIEVGAIAGEEE